MQATARRLSVVSAMSTPRRRLIRDVRPTQRAIREAKKPCKPLIQHGISSSCQRWQVAWVHRRRWTHRFILHLFPGYTTSLMAGWEMIYWRAFLVSSPHEDSRSALFQPGLPDSPLQMLRCPDLSSSQRSMETASSLSSGGFRFQELLVSMILGSLQVVWSFRIVAFSSSRDFQPVTWTLHHLHQHEQRPPPSKGEQNGCRQRLEGHLSCQPRPPLAVA